MSLGNIWHSRSGKLLTDFAVEADDAEGVGSAAENVAEESAGAGIVVGANLLGGHSNDAGDKESGDGEELHVEGWGLVCGLEELEAELRVCWSCREKTADEELVSFAGGGRERGYLYSRDEGFSSTNRSIPASVRSRSPPQPSMAWELVYRIQ